MGFTIPNIADAGFPAQAAPDKVDLDVLAAGSGHTGVESGCAVTASSGLTLAVAAGFVHVAGTRVTVASGNVTVTATHGSLNRFDLVVVDVTGAKSVTAGTATTDPVFPSIPASSVVLAAVYVPANDTVIASNQITDKRVPLLSPATLKALLDPELAGTYATTSTPGTARVAVDTTTNQSVAGDKTWTGAAIVKADAVYDVRAYPGWDPIAADNDAAYTAAIAAAFAAGGGDVLLPPLLKLATAPEVTENVNLKGRGSGQVGGGSIIELTAAAARVKFGNPTVPASGGISEGFRIDGDNVANVGLYTGCVVGRSFKNIDIVDTLDAGHLAESTQNCDFETLNIQRAGNDCQRIDRGAGSNHFGKCEFGSGGRYALNIVATSAAGLPAGVVPGPINNVWNDGCIFEYDLPSTLAVVHVSAGDDNVISDSTVVSTQVLTLIELEVAGVATSSTLRFRGGTLQFNFVDAASTVLDQSGSSRFFQEGKTNLLLASTIGRYDGATGVALWDQPIIPAAAVWSVRTGGWPYYHVRRALDATVSIAPGAAGTYTKRIGLFDANGTLEGWLHVFDQ